MLPDKTGFDKFLIDKSHCDYQAFFCEENIWQLIQRVKQRDRDLALSVLFFLNRSNSVFMANQLAFGPSGVGCWDYHVVMYVPSHRQIIDFDTRLGFHTDVEDYFQRSFQKTFLGPVSHSPDTELVVRVIDGDDYATAFWSDRSHMLDSRGNPLAPFPSWPTIQNEPNSLKLDDLRYVSAVDSNQLSLNGSQDLNDRKQDPRITDYSAVEFLNLCAPNQ